MINEDRLKRSFQKIKEDFNNLNKKLDKLHYFIEKKNKFKTKASELKVNRNIPVVILAGGRGYRLREETEFKPKPMVNIGKKPILWHIMKLYSHHGFKDFIICLGYKGKIIKNYFLNYEWMDNDFTLNLKDRNKWFTHRNKNEMEDWNITLADTKVESKTATRIKLVEKYIKSDVFFLTYGDGVADINIDKLLNYHKKMGKIATITGVIPSSRFGLVKEEGGIVKEFWEKPKVKERINAGFMVFNKEIFDYIDENKNEMLAEHVLPKIAKKRQSAIYKHDGYWACMDNYRDYLYLNEIWNSGKVPWKIWDG